MSFVPLCFSVLIAILHCFRDCSVTFMPSQFSHKNHEGQADILNDNVLLHIESKEIEKFVTKCSECSHTRAEKRSKRKPKFHVKNMMPKMFFQTSWFKEFPWLALYSKRSVEVSNLFQICSKWPNIDMRRTESTNITLCRE